MQALSLPQLSRKAAQAFCVITSDQTTSSSALPDSTGRPSNLFLYAVASARSSAARLSSEQISASVGESALAQGKLGVAAAAGDAACHASNATSAAAPDFTPSNQTAFRCAS